VASQKARPKYSKSRQYQDEEKVKKDAKSRKKVGKSTIQVKK